ncbi:MAG: lamin tail domain-containing protein [Phycisphaerales bacterium]
MALAVRRPLRARGLGPNLDAEDEHFLFPGTANNSGFPDRRDLLCIPVEIPGEAEHLFVMVHHAKARSGANRSSDRAGTDPRREEAARAIISVLEQRFDGKRYVLLGDMNDNPDDASMNILEMGMPNAPAGPEEIAGPFLLNLTEDLVVQDRVSWGLKATAVANGKINTVKAGSRQRNNAERGGPGGVSPILFDQILIPVSMGTQYVAGSVTVFDDPCAVVGGQNAASDHLPVYADFVIGGSAPQPLPVPASQITIVELLPDPAGEDRGNEVVVLANSGGSTSLSGWKLRDRAGNTHVLTGNIEAQARVTITLPAGILPLNNDGDEVSLLSPGGEIVHHVSYGAAQVRAGERVAFP